MFTRNKVLWSVLAWLLLVGIARAQSPVPITGTIYDSAGNVATSGTVEFSIQPQSSGIQYYVQGIGVIAPQVGICNISSTGTLTSSVNTANACTVWGNDAISPANTTYTVTFKPNGFETNSVAQESITGLSYNLNTPVFAPVVTIIPQYNTITSPQIQTNIIPGTPNVYSVGNAQAFFAAGYFDNLFAHSLTINGQQVLTGGAYQFIQQNGTPVAQENTVNFTSGMVCTDVPGLTTNCSVNFPAGSVTSVFGRAGNVVAVSGDYSFNEISGVATPSQLPLATSTTFGIVEPDNSTITVTSGVLSIGTVPRANALSGTPVPCGSGQVAGGIAPNGNAINCLTNYVPPTFTGASGYQIASSGLITEWGHTSTFDTGPVNVTFPLTFPNAVYSVTISGDETCNSASRIWSTDGLNLSYFVAKNDGLGCAYWQAVGY